MTRNWWKNPVAYRRTCWREGRREGRTERGSKKFQQEEEANQWKGNRRQKGKNMAAKTPREKGYHL
jgi:hypothetical protein